MSRILTTFIAALVCATAGQSQAAQHNLIPTGVNTDFNWFDAGIWGGTVGGVPINGNTVDVEIENRNHTFDLNNGGLGVNLSLSTIDIGRGTYFDSSAGGNPALANDAFIGDVIRMNGAGGAAPVFNVPVIANTFTSNRHGAIFNREVMVDTILANSGHQDRWQFNVSPINKISFIDLDENRGPDGGNIDGFFAVNADMQVMDLVHTWSELRVGDGVTMEVDKYDYSDYTNQASNNNINPIELGDGALLSVVEFNIIDEETSISSALGSGTYGSVGNPDVDFQVAFISGDGVLAVGSSSIGGAIPEPTSALLCLLAAGGLGMRRRRLASVRC